MKYQKINNATGVWTVYAVSDDLMKEKCIATNNIKRKLDDEWTKYLNIDSMNDVDVEWITKEEAFLMAL